MINIFCIGETVYDIVFKDSKPVAAKAGGSMLNSSVSMGRIGLPVHFISEYGLDLVGGEIDQFLKASNVGTSFVYRYIDGKTSIAIAFLNDKNDATYSFYKHLPKTRLDIEFPEVKANDFVLFGSFYSINSEIRNQLVNFIKQAKNAGAIIIYDPNFRKAHLHELPELKPFIIENCQMSTIVRGSDEDFKMIFNAKNIKESYQEMIKYCKVLIYTQNADGVHFISPENEIFIETPKIEPVSTIGAGDNFNAGLIYGLYSNNVKLAEIEQLNSVRWKEIIHHGIAFASEVCMSYDNYISSLFAKNY